MFGIIDGRTLWRVGGYWGGGNTLSTPKKNIAVPDNNLHPRKGSHSHLIVHQWYRPGEVPGSCPGFAEPRERIEN